MQSLNNIFEIIDSHIGGSYWFIILLLGTGIFFTIYLKFPQLFYFKHALTILTGKYHKTETKGDTSHFQALSTALSGTIGTGNIAGVALAIHLGGPASIFWMIVTAFFGMTTKLVEVTLSHKYREISTDGTISGGPMYYMKNKLNLKWLGVIFAIATILSSLGTGNLPQINSIANSMHTTFGINKMSVGAVLAILLGLVIIGGIKRIAKVTEKLVPMMTIIYFLGTFTVLLYNYENILPSLYSIVGSVFTGTAAVGGFLGANIAFAINKGVNRGLFSNEAGQGSSPIAHASTRTDEPVKEGLVALLEPFIDTIIVCLLTALVLLSSGVWNEKIKNKFQYTDTNILAIERHNSKKIDTELLSKYISNDTILPLFTGAIQVEKGTIKTPITIIHSRSLAEEVKIYENGKLYSGSLKVERGKIPEQATTIVLEGKSLLSSAPLTTEAFTRGFLGEWGRYIVVMGLLLFAFSTSVAWAYYGEKAITFLVGLKYIIYYRLLYVISFFIASFIDTTIIWTLSGITVAFMTIPNLIGILALSKDMKSSLTNYCLKITSKDS